MTPVLVIGKTGQMAQALALKGGNSVVCLGRPDADLTNAASLAQALDEYKPGAVINTGAYTSVDGAESEPEAARALNVAGPEALAKACAARDVPLIHLSTDCVFDGTKGSPYLPLDETCPIGVYGTSKRDGELAVLAAAPRSLVVRVSWIFSRFGRTFVRVMLDLARTRETITVVNDQFGCPTHAPDLAAALLDMATQVSDPGFNAWGTYHLAGRGETDRATMARKIFDYSRRNGGPVAEVVPIATSEFPTPAQRPLNARLDMSDTTRVFGLQLPPWEAGLEQTVGELVKEYFV